MVFTHRVAGYEKYNLERISFCVLRLFALLGAPLSQPSLSCLFALQLRAPLSKLLDTNRRSCIPLSNSCSHPALMLIHMCYLVLGPDDCFDNLERDVRLAFEPTAQDCSNS